MTGSLTTTLGYIACILGKAGALLGVNFLDEVEN
jgi:hypothetical protein